jgi:transposase-like protein
MTATAISSLGEVTEVTEKAKRRAFTVEYKRKIVKEADACKGVGDIGALLRREGLYSSQLTAWRQARDQGELAPGVATKKRGPKAAPVDPRDKKIAELERQIAKVTTRAERAEAIAEIQKNDRVRPIRPPVGPETPDVGSMASREE